MKNSNIQYQTALATLNQLYGYLNEVFFESALSTEPVITINYEKNNNVFGCYHTTEKWFNNSDDSGNKQINLSAQHLNRTFYELVGTLLHEMCHQYADELGIKDTSRNGTWHNKNFKEIAERHGLVCTKAEKIGFSVTTLTEESKIKLREKYPEGISILYHKTIETIQKEKRPSSTRKYVCPGCDDSVRATKDVRIICGKCNKQMIKVQA